MPRFDRTARFRVGSEPQGVRLTARFDVMRRLWIGAIAAALVLGALPAVNPAALWALPLVGLLAAFSALETAFDRAWNGVIRRVRRSLFAGLREGDVQGYRLPAAERVLEIDGERLPASAVLAVEVRSVTSGTTVRVSREVLLLVLSDGPVLVDLGGPPGALVGVARRLRDALALPAPPEPLSPQLSLHCSVVASRAGMVVALLVATPFVVAQWFGWDGSGAARAVTLGGATSFGALAAAWLGSRIAARALRRQIRRALPVALSGGAPVAVNVTVPGLEISHDHETLRLRSVVGPQSLGWLRVAMSLVATTFCVVAAVVPRWSLATMAVLLSVLASHFLLRSWSRRREVLIRPGALNDDGEIESSSLEVDGQRWPSSAPITVVVAAVPARGAMWHPVYVVGPGEVIDVAGAANAETAMNLGVLVRSALRLPGRQHDRPLGIPGSWRLPLVVAARMLSVATVSSVGATSIAFAPEGPEAAATRLTLALGTVVGLLALDVAGDRVQGQAWKWIARRLARDLEEGSPR